MKTIIIILFTLAGAYSHAQSSSERTTKELSFEKKTADNTLIIDNIFGDVTITGYDGVKILLEAVTTLKAKTDGRLEKAKHEVQIDVIDRADTLIVFVKDGCNNYGVNDGKNRNGNGWGYRWNCNDNCNRDYDYEVQFTLKVPTAINIIVSTVNEGEIVVEKMLSSVKATNVNGGIRLTGLMREAHAHTINGDVDIEYRENPSAACRFYTLNGDINATFKKGLAAQLAFESFNGEFFTNIEKIEPLPTQVVKASDKEGIKFKVNDNRYQVGDGGALLDFETFNGNVYLKEL